MNVLLAVDGSDSAYEAARALTHLTPPTKVILLHAMDIPIPMYPSVIPEVAREIQDTVERAMREEGERLLNRVSSLLSPGIGPVVKRLGIGKPTSVILEVAEQEQIHLILMGARGVGHIRELILGSVSHRVVSHARCPTLIVGAPMQALRHVLLAVKDQEDADAAITYLSTRPFREQCEITVLTVIPYVSPAWPVGTLVPDTYRRDISRQGMEFVIQVAGRLAALGYRATSEALLGMPAGEIIQAASKRRTDLILMGSRHKGLSRLALGSVSHTVLHKAPCAVLVVR